MEKVTLIFLGFRANKELPAIILIQLVDLSEKGNLAVLAPRMVEVCPGEVTTGLCLVKGAGPEQPELVGTFLAHSLLNTELLVTLTPLG